MAEYLSELSPLGATDDALRHFDDYWSEPDRWPYVIEVDAEMIGFALVNRWSPSGRGTDFSIAEFFVERRARRRGYGLSAACQVLQSHRGHWEIAFFKRNVTAEAFWIAAIAAAGVPSHDRTEEAGAVIIHFLQNRGGGGR
jgi:predicted acetyltransferase